MINLHFIYNRVLVLLFCSFCLTQLLFGLSNELKVYPNSVLVSPMAMKNRTGQLNWSISTVAAYTANGALNSALNYSFSPDFNIVASVVDQENYSMHLYANLFSMDYEKMVLNVGSGITNMYNSSDSTLSNVQLGTYLVSSITYLNNFNFNTGFGHRIFEKLGSSDYARNTLFFSGSYRFNYCNVYLEYLESRLNMGVSAKLSPSIDIYLARLQNSSSDSAYVIGLEKSFNLIDTLYLEAETTNEFLKSPSHLKNGNLSYNQYDLFKMKLLQKTTLSVESYMDLKDYENAIVILKHAVQKFPNNHYFHIKLAQSYFELGQLDLFRAQVKNMLSFNLYSRDYYSLSEPAFDYIKKDMLLAFNNAESFKFVTDTYDSLVLNTLTVIDDHDSMQDIEGLANLYRQLLLLSPFKIDYYTKCITYYLQLNKINDAVEIFNKAELYFSDYEKYKPILELYRTELNTYLKNR